MPAELITKLQALQHRRSDTSPFASHTMFLTWSDNVLPLLSFNPNLQDEFQSATLAANSNHHLGSVAGTIENINRTIGILNQAVATLENPLPAITSRPELKVPEKLTLKWLYQHAPFSFYIWLFSALVVAFSVGFNLSKILTPAQSTVTPIADIAAPKINIVNTPEQKPVPKLKPESSAK